VIRHLAKIMLMKMKQSQHQQHEDETRQSPSHHLIDLMGGSSDTVGNQMQQSDAKHEPRHYTQHHLSAGVSHDNLPRQPTPQQGYDKKTGAEKQ
jgi:ATP-dependent protease HslVU (ClpYQ) ATPase subunit